MTDAHRHLCPLCGYEYTRCTQLENGSWVFEPLKNVLGDLAVTDADGMLCASWDESGLDLYVHSESQTRGDPPQEVEP